MISSLKDTNCRYLQMYVCLGGYKIPGFFLNFIAEFCLK